jgi:5-methylcytosine-specific restriction endonuclease McrA
MEEQIMDAYSYTKKSDEILRNAIHKAYGKKCFYCGEKINMYQLELDHIIPNDDKDMPKTVELQEYLEELKEKNFIRLQPENKSMSPIIVNDCKILGRLVGLYRAYK